MYVRPKLTFVSFFLCFFCTFPLGDGAKKHKNLTNVRFGLRGRWTKKTEKKLTNVS